MPFTKNSFFNTTWVTVIASILAFAIAIIALTGWTLDYEILKNFNPGWATIKVNTALGILFSTISLLLFVKGKNNLLASVLAILVFLLGAISLCEYLFSWDAHIDQLIFQDKGPASLGYPGRMAKATTIGFIFLGISLILFYSNKRIFIIISEAFAILVLLFSLITFVSYFYRATQFFKSIQLSAVSLPTVISGMLISVGILFSRPETGMLSVFNKQTVAAKLGLRGILIATILIVLLGWLRIKSEELSIFDKALGISIMAIIFSIIFFFATWVSTRRLNIAEEKINASQKMFSAIFFQSPVLNVIADVSTGKYIEVNDNFAEFIGLKKEDIIGKTAVELDLIVNVKQRQEIIDTIKEKGFITDTVIEVRNKNKESRWISTSAHRVKINGKECFLTAMIDITDRKKAEQQIEESYQAIQKLTERLHTVREEERKSIAREIHDELGQQLAVLKMDISWLKNAIISGDDITKQKLENLLELSDSMVKSFRRIYSGLRPSLLDDMGIAAAIDWHLSEFGKNFSVNTQFIEPEHELDLNEAMKTNLFRIFQESMSNVARHADAQNIVVALEQKNGDIIMCIEDDGKGFEKDNIADQKTLGILGMKERCRMLGGTYEIRSMQGKGTTIIVTIPIEA